MIRGEGKGFKRRSVGRIAVLAALLVGMLGGTVFGASTVKKYHDIPAYQMRDVYSQKQVKIGPIDVRMVISRLMCKMMLPLRFTTAPFRKSIGW